MTFPSRSPERRRAEYERNIARTKRRYAEHKETPDYARMILARELGLPKQDVPTALVEARFRQIQLRRAIRDAEQERLYPKIRDKYLAGATVRELADEHGFDRGRVAGLLKDSGITPKRRPECRNGHAMTDENATYSPEGWRRCRKCACERTRRYELKKKQA